MTTSTWQRVEALEPAECMRLLASVRMGRLGLSSPAGPQVLPVNHTVLDGAVLFRTDLYSSIADATRDAVVAFEADELDDRLASGWSVLVVGPAQHVEDRAEVADAFARMISPWAPGTRTAVVKVTPSQVSGRRFTRAG